MKLMSAFTRFHDPLTHVVTGVRFGKCSVGLIHALCNLHAELFFFRG